MRAVDLDNYQPWESQIAIAATTFTLHTALHRTVPTTVSLYPCPTLPFSCTYIVYVILHVYIAMCFSLMACTLSGQDGKICSGTICYTPKPGVNTVVPSHLPHGIAYSTKGAHTNASPPNNSRVDFGILKHISHTLPNHYTTMVDARRRGRFAHVLQPAQTIMPCVQKK